ncbi:MAG: FHA domain-containing protein [Anaerolineae bacterium]|nr:FHA domain-containing protein [Anaerolineae bacterium]
MDGALICEWCGEPLVDIDPGTTHNTRPERAPLNPYESKVTAFEAPSAVVLQVRNAEDAYFTIEMPDAPVTLGRSDLRTGLFVDIDLTPFDATKLGVSRRHAVLDWDEDGVTIQDLGSANGTLLNGHHLEPDFRRIVCDGDEIMLGKLALRVRFVA